MQQALAAAAILNVLIWLGLLLGRGGFWRMRERLDGEIPELPTWPAVVAVMPARNEAAVIARSVASVVTQDYPGPLAVILVDDHSTDGTADIARAAAQAAGRPERLAVLRSRPLPQGWTGKLWALSEGLREAGAREPDAPYVWFTDADIAHDPTSLRRLVGKAEREGRDLVSLMVLLSCEAFLERLLIPPFVFFFSLLYPFPYVNDPRRRLGAAAGGCVLLRRAALERAGGLGAIRGRIIDDCALGQLVKARGRPGGAPVWLGLTRRLRSIRPYEGLQDIWSMVARSAYTQLRHSPLLLAGTLAGMVLTYLAGPAALLTYPWHGDGLAAAAGALAWVLMSGAIAPTLRLYRQPLWFAPLLPVVAVFYSVMTADSALAHARGRGGAWKGRVQRSDGREGAASEEHA
ncbi:MAG TPA: glycosyltransferase [Microvirga sp.]|jgi:hopene-associated glycosyltransferase HpnB|nr:glycosyltransferase [Microvirga sp.]